jgi:hypothetical protein
MKRDVRNTSGQIYVERPVKDGWVPIRSPHFTFIEAYKDAEGDCFAGAEEGKKVSFCIFISFYKSEVR